MRTSIPPLPTPTPALHIPSVVLHPESLFAYPDFLALLSAPQLKIYLLLSARAHPDGTVSASPAKLARGLSLSRRTVHLALSTLRSYGLLHSLGHRSNHWQLPTILQHRTLLKSLAKNTNNFMAQPSAPHPHSHPKNAPIAQPIAPSPPPHPSPNPKKQGATRGQ